jgi:ABC-type transporter Mla subunit MlaD
MNLNYELSQFFHVREELILPLVVSAGIFLFALIFFTAWTVKINKVAKSLSDLKTILNRNEFVGLNAFENAINKTKDIKLKSLLIETKENLIEIEGDIDIEQYSLKSYSDIWTVRGALTGKLNLSLFETMPNILIGAGLMFTFIFLAWALADAGGAMGGVNTQAKDAAMKSLIANAGGKFTSSIVGLFCSLTWNWRAKVSLEKLQINISELHASLRRIAPDTAAQAIIKRQHSIFKEMLNESREQVGQLKRFETDIAVAIAKAIGNEINPSFKALGADLVEAIKQLTDRIGNMNEDALEKMIAQFIEEFRGTSSAEMQEFKTALTQLAENLNKAGKTIGEDIGTAGTTFGAAAGNLENAIVKAQETVEYLDTSLQKAGDVVSVGADRFEEVSDKLVVNIRLVETVLGTTDAFIENMSKLVGSLNNISDSLDDSIDSQKVISAEFRDAIPKVTKALSDAVLEISLSSEAAAGSLTTIREELDNTKTSLGETVKTISTGVDDYTNKVTNLHLILDDKIGDAVSKIGSAVIDMTDAIEELADALPKK